MRLRLSIATAVIVLVVPILGSQASDLFHKGQKFEKVHNYTQAYLLYTEAATLEPGNTRYRIKAATLQSKAAKNAKIDLPPASTPVADAVDAEPKPEDFTSITAYELSRARKAQSPSRLNLPAGRFDLNLAGDPKSVFDQVAQRCGLQTSYDGDYQQLANRVRFNITDATCLELLRQTEAATGSFVVPLSSKLIFISKDTPAKRIDNEQTMSVVIPIPTALTVQEITEIAQAVRQTTGVDKIAWNSATNEIVMRDRVSRVIPAMALIEQLAAYRGTVMVDVRFMALSKSDILKYGVNLTNSIPIIYGGNFLNAQSAIAAAASSSSVSQAATAVIKLLGQGKTLFGIGAIQASVVANLTNSDARTILETQVRAVSGFPSTLHVGDKYPVLTSGYFGTGATAGSAGVYTPTPSFTFEDLGVSLKVTPIVSNEYSITIDVESEYKLLAGSSANGIPVIANRKISSRVSVKNDEWAVIAGLMDETNSRSVAGVAGLARIPLLGWLFKTVNKEKDRDHILVLLKPHIIGLPPGSRTTRELWVGSDNRPLSPM